MTEDRQPKVYDLSWEDMVGQEIWSARLFRQGKIPYCPVGYYFNCDNLGGFGDGDLYGDGGGDGLGFGETSYINGGGHGMGSWDTDYADPYDHSGDETYRMWPPASGTGVGGGTPQGRPRRVTNHRLLLTTTDVLERFGPWPKHLYLHDDSKET